METHLQSRYYLMDMSKQQTAVSSTTVTVTLKDLRETTVNRINLYLASGSPKDPSNLLTTALTFTPQVWEINPTTASEAGATVLITVVGVGFNTVDLDIKAGTDSLCSSYEVISYSKVKCTTVAASFTSKIVKVGGVTCKNPTTTACEYSTYAGASLTSANVSGDKIII